ncbi:Transposon Tf2-8 polyprotein [Erysiphe neolycopersici]|uniref:Transposon Tf2-8 polyprotein n=1 Tax=Erysiphe neolycopersici TaxID=212602 RepID=A0A420H9Z8_9PEZI|nr:Transposon Tf2-8 polyprotein [Erysiphe neolycopersici]
MLNDEDDKILTDRSICLLKSDILVASHVDAAILEDRQYMKALEAVKTNAYKFSIELNLKVSISECSVSNRDRFLFREREWIPEEYYLRTKLIQLAHDSPLSGHPGREISYSLVARQYFWPGMDKDIRRFVEDCDGYAWNKAWCNRRQRFLKPLPILDRIWTEISMDFITKLPISEGCINMIVGTDRLSKGVIADGLEAIDAESVAKWFIKRYLPSHFLPSAIVSDRGTQFTSAFWKRLSDLLRINRQLSTAFSPETDGSTERANEVIETILTQYINWNQTDWLTWITMFVSSICWRDSASQIV